MAKRPPKTLLEVVIARGGYRKGMRVATYVEQWTIAQRDLGHVPTVEEAAAWWKEVPRTWWRRQADFHDIFPDLSTPAPIATALLNGSLAPVERGSVIAKLAHLPAQAAQPSTPAP